MDSVLALEERDNHNNSSAAVSLEEKVSWAFPAQLRGGISSSSSPRVGDVVPTFLPPGLEGTLLLETLGQVRQEPIPLYRIHCTTS